MKEIWKAIPESAGMYGVSNLGSVRSIDRLVNGRWGLTFYKGRVLKSHRKGRSRGYPTVVLQVNGRSLNRTVHRLVAEAFIPNPNGFPMVRHLDDVRTNNIKSNLKWGTMSDNFRDMRCWKCGAPYHKRPKREIRK